MSYHRSTSYATSSSSYSSSNNHANPTENKTNTFSTQNTTSNGPQDYSSPTTTGHRYASASHTTPSGTTTIRSGYQNLGEDPIFQERRIDSAGREYALPDVAGGRGENSLAGGTRTIRDAEADEGDVDDFSY
ncbi:hypothetical protein BO78DRAFT_395380 [Aspergillus sclerotiicarbonarius CBS 121057]|uniref:Uncharacterized protein n=1 Tax=Aspergillus sclerotiicarbonarius (strain CBS 121057 / IBT 28362) TaxID=1448318 RepID=A0A319EET3_ASPSB|nr:hypothetical protein BO78DRAFT_395380 [Aspergillus sclerotiicarbonarius CBS 121057]